jgi:SAM-dependent methyltransferase
MKKINYFFNFIWSYRNLFLQVFFFEIFYSLRFKELIPLMKVHNHKSRTDTIPCVFFFLHEISKFIKKNKIKSIVDVGSGFGRVVNFISTINLIRTHGIEYDKEVYKYALKGKKKGVKLYCGDIFNFKLDKFNSNCFILIDPFKKIKDRNKFLSHFKKMLPRKDKYLITVNIFKGKFPKHFNLIYSKIASKSRCLKIYKVYSK